jgi:hypothetical protein
MQMNQVITHASFPVQAQEASFNSVWGNEMQREDFLALAAGVRQFSADLALLQGEAVHPERNERRAAE